MSKKNKKSIYEYQEVPKEETFEELHNKRVKEMNRRELLSAGLIKFTAGLTLPSIYQILAQNGVAEAQEIYCPEGNSSGLCPVITINLAGGAGLSAQFIPRDEGGALLPSYSRMGLGNLNQAGVDGSGIPALEQDFGGLPGEIAAPVTFAPIVAGSAGSFLQGVRTSGINGTRPLAMDKTAFVGVCVQSRDDSAVNKFDISGMVAKAGLVGGILPNLGRANSSTGMRQNYAIIKPPTPLVVGNVNDLGAALGVAGRLNLLSSNQKTKVFRLVQSLSGSQARKLASVSGGQNLLNLVHCATGSNTALSQQDASAIQMSQEVMDIWGVTDATAANNQMKVFGTMVYNALIGNAGTVNLEMGGYDYHNGTRTSGETRDAQVGDVVGKILETARVLNQKIMLNVVSDGSVTAADDTFGSVWTSDRGNAGMAYMMAFDPVARPLTSSFQLGNFTTGQESNSKFITGNSPELAAAAMFANYLALNRKVGAIEQVIPRTFSQAELESVLRFQG